MKNCYINLGDRIWQQITGIPMGFACSPLWYNMYLLFYESRFIQRLAQLGKPDLMALFQFAYRYIDDLCWFNNGMAKLFLSSTEERASHNPFWIYPLHILEIKCEITRYSGSEPKHGLEAHFMNLNVSILDLDNQRPNYRLSKFDKRRDLPFQYSQYIMFQSNRLVK